MAIRLRDRQVHPWMQPGGRFITLSSVALKWTGLLLTCLSSLGVAVLQRGLLKMDSYSTLEDLAAALADPSNGTMNVASMAVSCSLISAMLFFGFFSSGSSSVPTSVSAAGGVSPT